MFGVHGSHLMGTIALILISWIQYTLLIVPFIHWNELYLTALALFTLNLTLLFSVACTDPGILPRQHFRNEKSASANIIRKDAMALHSNFCKICNIWRPSRARHCKYCDNCVDIFDHHCPVSMFICVIIPKATPLRSLISTYSCMQWTGTCIGMRNYPQFFAFVSSVLMSSLFILACAVYLLLGWVLVGATTDMPLLRIVALGTTIPWCCTMLFLVGTLLVFHVYLIYRGQTTNEYFREKRALRRVPATASAPTEGSNRTTSACCQSTLPWSSTTTNSRQVTTSDDVYNSINTTAEGEDPRVPASPGQIGHETASLQLSINDVNESMTTAETKDSMLYAVTHDMLQTTAELLLTPLFDADSTPFPHLSPSPLSPQSPESPQYTNAPAHPPLSTARRTPPRYPLDHTTSPVVDHDIDVKPQPQSTMQVKGRCSLSGQRPQLSLALPAIEEVKSESDRSAPSNQPSHDMVTQDSAVLVPSSETDSADGTTGCAACAIVCLPCYAMALAVEQGGCLRTSQPTHAHERQAPRQGHCVASDYYSTYSYSYSADAHSHVHSGAVPQASPDRAPRQQNSRYTYAYLCGFLPIIPHSRLLPMWQWEDEQDAAQQEAMLEVLFDQLRVALRSEALNSDDFSV